LSIRIDWVEVTHLTPTSARIERVCRVEKPNRCPVWYQRWDSRSPKNGDVVEVYHAVDGEAWVIIC
jgi:hypothetical protein